MKKLNKKYLSRKGVVLITVVSLSFILLALGIMIMQGSFYQMSSSVEHKSRSEALIIAEYGVNRAIYELEMNTSWTGIEESFGKGKYKVEVQSNFDNPNPAGLIPARSFLVKSTGITETGRKKIALVVISRQLVPYSILSDERIMLNGTNGYSFYTSSIAGFNGKFHSNYNGAGSPFDSASTTDIYAQNITFTSEDPNMVTDPFRTKVEDSGGIIGPGSNKDIPGVKYSDLKPSSGLIEVGEISGIADVAADFLGKIRNNGGKLEVYLDLMFPLGKTWKEIGNSALPEGMTWDSSSETLTVDGTKKYYRDGDLELINMNVEVLESDSNPELYIDGKLKVTNSQVRTAGSTGLFSGKDIEFKNSTIQTGNSSTDEGSEIFCNGNFTITTPADYAPSGGNYIHGSIHAGNNITINNQCTLSGSDNSMAIEGVMMAGKNFYLNNTGNSDFDFYLKYNPYLAGDSMRDKSDIQLQPVFWQIK